MAPLASYRVAVRADEAARLQSFEQENAQLNRILADQALDIRMLKDLKTGKF